MARNMYTIHSVTYVYQFDSDRFDSVFLLAITKCKRKFSQAY